MLLVLFEILRCLFYKLEPEMIYCLCYALAQSIFRIIPDLSIFSSITRTGYSQDTKKLLKIAIASYLVCMLIKFHFAQQDF